MNNIGEFFLKNQYLIGLEMSVEYDGPLAELVAILNNKNSIVSRGLELDNAGEPNQSFFEALAMISKRIYHTQKF